MRCKHKGSSCYLFSCWNLFGQLSDHPILQHSVFRRCKSKQQIGLKAGLTSVSLMICLTQPFTVPTILAASSFVGLGVITSDVYISDNEQWLVTQIPLPRLSLLSTRELTSLYRYLNTANFLRSIRNFKIDIRLTNPTAYICGIHWQVAQATSLENIEFYMLYNSDSPKNTQQVRH